MLKRRAASRFPLPASRFPLPASRFPLPASRFPLLPPDRRFLGPARVLIALAERFPRLLQRVVVVGFLVSSDPGPVQSFGRCVGVGKPIDDLTKPLLGLLPILTCELDLRSAEHELRQKIVIGKKSFDAVTLDTVRVELEDGRRPGSVVLVAVPFEECRVR